ncbi:hypothetical protein CRG98_028833 [Punica granatum]|uniref:Uncharacterized protein n=1 Tax=Punica granatum TaxID=22663 RepID=A0A2I0J3G9_PUNGR|nr:hypothetical protein CRG98_028833 [Punica granatum]
MDPRRPKRLTALLHEAPPRGSRASPSPCRSPPLGSDPSSVMHAFGSGGYRNTGWFSDDFGRFWPWHGLDEDLECLNEEDLNEPNIAIRRVTNVQVTRRLESRFCPIRTFGVELSVSDPRLPLVHLNVRFGDLFASCGIVGSSSSTEDRWPGKT